MTIHASVSDIEDILDICEEGQKLSENYCDLPTDRETARRSLLYFMTDPYSFVGYNGHGVVVATAAPSWYSKSYHIANVFLYARKHGLNLAREYIAWAKGFPGRNQIYIGVSYMGDKGDRSEKLFEKLGCVKTGSNYKVN